MAPTPGVPDQRRRASGLTILGCGLFAFTVHAVMTHTGHAQANCEWYGQTAVRQQQINEEKKCGLQGEAWHKDLNAHIRWCATVAPDAWKLQAQERNRQLEACDKKQGG